MSNVSEPTLLTRPLVGLCGLALALTAWLTYREEGQDAHIMFTLVYFFQTVVFLVIALSIWLVYRRQKPPLKYFKHIATGIVCGYIVVWCASLTGFAFKTTVVKQNEFTGGTMVPDNSFATAALFSALDPPTFIGALLGYKCSFYDYDNLRYDYGESCSLTPYIAGGIAAEAMVAAGIVTSSFLIRRPHKRVVYPQAI